MNVFITDAGFSDVNTEREIVEKAGHTLHLKQCKSEEDLLQEVTTADALIVQWAPVSAKVIEALVRRAMLTGQPAGGVFIKNPNTFGFMVHVLNGRLMIHYCDSHTRENMDKAHIVSFTNVGQCAEFMARIYPSTISTIDGPDYVKEYAQYEAHMLT